MSEHYGWKEFCDLINDQIANALHPDKTPFPMDPASGEAKILRHSRQEAMNYVMEMLPDYKKSLSNLFPVGWDLIEMLNNTEFGDKPKYHASFGKKFGGMGIYVRHDGVSMDDVLVACMNEAFVIEEIMKHE